MNKILRVLLQCSTLGRVETDRQPQLHRHVDAFESCQVYYLARTSLLNVLRTLSGEMT
jgi:hypothetical protein